MKCDRARDLFSKYLEGALDSNLRAELEEHLGSCRECEASYDRFHATVMLLEEIPEVETPPGFHSAVMSRIEQARRTAPRPVRWWAVDWQRVFTARVPARAVAAGFAVVILLALAVQLTPLNNIAAGMLFGKRAPESIIAERIDAPLGPRPYGTLPEAAGRYYKSESGLSISVSADSSQGQRNVYLLRLETQSQDPVDFRVYLLPDGATGAGGERDQIHGGQVTDIRDAAVPVVVTHSGSLKRCVTAIVAWEFAGRSYSQYLFLPSRFDAAGSAKLGLALGNVGVYDAAAAISAQYGAVILAPGNLESATAAVDLQRGGAEDALKQLAASGGLRWRQLGSSIYALE